MAWIILEGLDRTGKSTVAKVYEKEGYEVVHMSAPNKKYFKPGYVGPSYVDELLSLYMNCDGKDVVFDRSPYGELVWPVVYGRQSKLNEEELEVLRDFEDSNNTQKFLMIDSNREAHWKRCVENNEPLDYGQFNMANTLFQKMAHQHNFLPRQLDDWKDIIDRAPERTDADKNDIPSDNEAPNKEEQDRSSAGDAQAAHRQEVKKTTGNKTEAQEKLETANAINKVLSSKIIRIKGEVFEHLESDIREYLQEKLSILLGNQAENSDFSKEEVEILKIFCDRLKQKESK